MAPRAKKGRAILSALIIVAFGTFACLLLFASARTDEGTLPPDETQFMAFMILMMTLVLGYTGKKALLELEGDKALLLSKSKFHQAIEYGLITCAGGLILVVEASCRCLGFVPPWNFPWGTLGFVVLPATFGVLFWAAPKLSSSIGLS